MRAPLFAVAVIGLQFAVARGETAGSSAMPHLSPVVLTNVAQVRSLTATQAAEARPVCLRGVVVDESQPREHALILADQHASIYLVSATNLFAPYHPKDLLEIRGVTSKGEFAPCVLTTEAVKVGAAAIPVPRPATYQELITGALDAQFVEITGVVRQCWPALPDEDTWRIVLAANGGTIPIRIPLPQDPQIREDAEVTVQAVCLYQFNKRRQALSPVLQVPRGVSVRIIQPAPDDPYAAPIQSLTSLLEFSPQIPYGHRIHVRGIVTCAQPGLLVWIRDESSGLRIQTRQDIHLQPGDEIDVLGFPSYGSAPPILENSTCRKNRAAVPPAPLALTDSPDAYDHQDNLVSMQALLTDIQPVADGLVLTLENSKTVFKGILNLPSKANKKPLWQPGSLVRVTGICDLVYNDPKPVEGMWHPQAIQVLLRSSADVTVLKMPPWWTTRRVMSLLGVIAGGSLGVAGTVMLLARRRLKEHASRRAMAEAEFAAILSERNRMAREIHDSLAQGFAATLLQLQLVKLHASRDQNTMDLHLDRAQQMIRDSLQEARTSIWEMRSQVLETNTLAAALKNIIEHLSGGIIQEAHFEVVGRERRLSPLIENNVLRLGQEAITNATKYAQAKQISVKLEFGEKHLSLTVADNGRGFDPANPPPSEGGFGLVGMRERADGLNGKLNICSALNQGTKITLFIPLSGE